MHVQALIGAYRKEESSLSNRRKLFNSPDGSQKNVKTPNSNKHVSPTPVGVVKSPESPAGETLPEVYSHYVHGFLIVPFMHHIITTMTLFLSLFTGYTMQFPANWGYVIAEV